MHKLCVRDHKHANLQDGNIKIAAISFDKLCISILNGVREQLQESGLMSMSYHETGTVCEDWPEQNHEYLD